MRIYTGKEIDEFEADGGVIVPTFQRDGRCECEATLHGHATSHFCPETAILAVREKVRMARQENEMKLLEAIE